MKSIAILSVSAVLASLSPVLAASDTPGAWSTAKTCTITSPAASSPRVAMVATQATNELGKTVVTARIDLWISEILGTEAAPKFSDVKIEIPGRGTWSDLSATGRESGKTFRLMIQIPDGAKVPTAIAQGKTVVVTVGDKSFTADLSGSVVAINDISKCLG